jgi:Transcriptional regulator
VAGATRRRRSDAAQNREAILAVALAALTESSEVSLNAIAKRAGVANATLYRHFPTRESLVLEVYRHEVRQLVSTADHCWPNVNQATRCANGWPASLSTP